MRHINHAADWQGSSFSLTDRCLISNVLKQNVEGLKQLYWNISARPLLKDFQKCTKHVLLQEEIENFRVVLISPYQYLGNRADAFHKKVPVTLCHDSILPQNRVQVPVINAKGNIKRRTSISGMQE
jgi:hypothetical protein